MLLKIGQRWLNNFHVGNEHIIRLLEICAVDSGENARCVVLSSNNANYAVGVEDRFYNFPPSGQNEWFEYLIGQDSPEYIKKHI